MIGPPDVEQALVARRAALHARLVAAGMLPEVADRWIARWEAHGNRRSPTAWNAGFEWSSAFAWILSESAGSDRLPDH